jgi:hypothetical protein
VSDDVAELEDGSTLAGIGVLRNYGGEVLVVPCSGAIPPNIALRGHGRFDEHHRIVVFDDRDAVGWDHIAAAITLIGIVPWSQRERLAEFVINDRA